MNGRSPFHDGIEDLTGYAVEVAPGSLTGWQRILVAECTAISQEPHPPPSRRLSHFWSGRTRGRPHWPARPV